jgi:tetratricopeptide (TPR) repeat protein
MPVAAQEEPIVDGARALQEGESEKAALAFQRAIDADPGNATAWLGLSAAAEQVGNLPAALQAARRAAGLAPEQAEAQLALARLLGATGRVGEALAAFGRTRELAPAEEDAYLLAALLLRDEGRSEEALTLLEEGYRKSAAASPRLAEQLAFLALAAGDASRALEVVESALGSESAGGDLLLAKALALAAGTEGREESSVWFERALTAGVSHEGRARLEWGRLLGELADWPGAVAQLELATQLLPQEAEAFFRLGTALRQTGDIDGAREAMARYQELNQESVAAERRVREVGTALNEAQELAKANQLEEALARLDGVTDGESDVRVLVLRAKVLFSLARNDEALVAASRAGELAPYALEPAYLTAVFALAVDDYSGALGAVERTLSLDPGLAEAWALRGSVLARDQRLEEAVLSFERALALGFDSAPMRLEYAGVLSDLGRTEESREQLEARDRLSGG